MTCTTLDKGSFRVLSLRKISKLWKRKTKSFEKASEEIIRRKQKNTNSIITI